MNSISCIYLQFIIFEIHYIDRGKMLPKWCKLCFFRFRKYYTYSHNYSSNGTSYSFCPCLEHYFHVWAIRSWLCFFVEFRWRSLFCSAHSLDFLSKYFKLLSLKLSFYSSRSEELTCLLSPLDYKSKFCSTVNNDSTA